MFSQFKLFYLYLFLTPAVALASDISISPNGINSSILSQTGANIGIGQVEVFRPGIAADGAGNFHPDVMPTEVFHRNGPAQADYKAHATQVAGVMISGRKRVRKRVRTFNLACA